MMDKISDKQFEDFVSEAIDMIPKKYLDRLQNIAFIVEDEPSEAQRQSLKLKPHETLFGLYEGAPLPTRQGQLKMLPDKITIFKKPLLLASQNLEDLRQRVGKTLWHEVAHYYGLDHIRIYELEKKPPKIQD